MKKIVPCLDVKDGKVVKGIQFVGLRTMGDPVEMAAYYSKNGADELVFLDIAATTEARGTMLKWVRETAQHVTVPFTVGGGVKTLQDAEQLLEAGADKIGINSAAVHHPSLLKEIAEKYGSQVVVAAIDAKQAAPGKWHVMIQGGKHDTGLDAIEWAKEVEKLGAGEILLTSMDSDGKKDGYDLLLTKAVVDAVAIPVTASGGCGHPQHIIDVFKETNVAAALAASIFHEGTHTIQEVKHLCQEQGVRVK
ncbi:imidazole glycerol phosphate synthase subunit HisF [Bacillus chungangensis]|uniref:Imidazole glycerol phosphate synthase subunit HisF n=1 Tax=Bacillus chungangensis TaxID=587633 RepID=A0ABT9WW67_9BACI|nr:imidazole glycerol phosphate synthase subunit HisF [Bacillus chungangensis]MDQ0177421.1 cyclase [Bacillus chungangensis]